ncbi:HpcH/HpaI aldolase/citrate lyase family, putative [Trypanosoma equiperdum]|uniref:Uncharacterized protein n=2 Tax=Trypanozoon TaxID=39700 RepID=Q57TT1_TRYB2|nr:hypothetical protein, conserved [Trypanosoma brucei brucei TREU927]AAX80043.1 hypothetical protein, conserved [Trypanosoma brucei]AAZ13446.1 hypothetical protein, conserved [Trypanosoma brucei brucei TREU927]SCU67735.1 HpcH/HpaI aldolase/citrate lyase family, putative [Trypanosoma equiperdum]
MWKCYPLRCPAATGVFGCFKRLQDGYSAWCAAVSNQETASAKTSSRGSGAENTENLQLPIHTNPNACPRSVLVVPAGDIKDALRRQKRYDVVADVVMLDLTRGVFGGSDRSGGASEARDRLLRFLRESVRGDHMEGCSDDGEWKTQSGEGTVGQIFNGGRARWVVRVNSPEFDAARGFLDMELVGVLGDLIEGVVLPSVTANTYELVQEFIHPSHKLWAAFNTPLSVLQASAVCAQGHYRYAIVDREELAYEMQYPSVNSEKRSGSLNFSEDVEATQLKHVRSLPALHSACQVMTAAKAHGMYLFDGGFSDVSDSIGFRHDMQRCRAFGFDGRVVLRPSQIAACHEAFVPTSEEVEWAKAVQRTHCMDQYNVNGDNATSVGGDATCRRQRAALILERHAAVQWYNRNPQDDGMDMQRKGAGGNVPQGSVV